LADLADADLEFEGLAGSAGVEGQPHPQQAKPEPVVELARVVRGDEVALLRVRRAVARRGRLDRHAHHRRRRSPRAAVLGRDRPVVVAVVKKRRGRVQQQYQRPRAHDEGLRRGSKSAARQQGRKQRKTMMPVPPAVTML
jgi:hypothetical protein